MNPNLRSRDACDRRSDARLGGTNPADAVGEAVSAGVATGPDRTFSVQGFLSCAPFLSFRGRLLPLCVHVPLNSEPSLLISASYRPPTIFTRSVSLESFWLIALTGSSAPP